MDDSPFGKLPPELRNRIYELVLLPEEGLELHLKSGFGCYYIIPSSYNVAALSMTCKKIHEETNGFILAEADFCGRHFHLEENEEMQVMWNKRFKSWYDRANIFTGAGLRYIEVDVGVVTREDVKEKIELLAQRLLADMREQRRHGVVEYTIGVQCGYAELFTTFGVGYMSFPGSDLRQAKRMVEQATAEACQRQRTRRVHRPRKVVARSDAVMQRELQAFRQSVEFMVSLICSRYWRR